MVQLSLFAEENASHNLPLPLVVAERWGFSLQYHEIGDEHWYAIQDWIAGLIPDDDANKAWRNMKTQPVFSKDTLKKMPYRASNGKTYKIDFATAKILYDVAQYLRLTKERHALAAIRSYLSEAGAFMDEARLNPEIAQARMMEARRQKMERLGKGDEWLAERLEGMVARDGIEQAVKLYIANPQRWHYAMITNTEYIELFGRDASTLRSQNGGVAPRDGMTHYALSALRIAEYGIADMMKGRKEVTFNEALEIVAQITDIVRPMIEGMQDALGIDLATSRPLLR